MAAFLSATYDPDTGELRKLKFTPRFTAEPALLRADVLQDLLHEVEDAYYEALVKHGLRKDAIHVRTK